MAADAIELAGRVPVARKHSCPSPQARLQPQVRDRGTSRTTAGCLERPVSETDRQTDRQADRQRQRGSSRLGP
eukprot:2378233-Alexandrium_andersonii.AAC.1